jgi:hypothetical protein
MARGRLIRTTMSAPAFRTRRAASLTNARAVLLGFRDAVLEIELYAIGAPGMCLVDIFFDVDRDVEQRPPNRLPWGTIRCQD